MRLIATVVVLFSAPCAVAAEPDIKAYAMKSRSERPKALALAKQQLDSAKRRRQPKGVVESLEKRIAALENPLEPYYAPVAGPLKDAVAGTLGWFDDRVAVSQIIDDTNAFVNVHFMLNTSDITASGNVYQTEKPRTRMFQLKGPPTDQMEGEVTLNGVFAIKNGENSTLGGQNVPVIESVQIEPHKDLFTRKDELRTWTAKSGKTTKAIFVRYGRGKVTPMNLEGKTVDVSLSDLSDDDRDYVRGKIKELTPTKPRRRD